MHNFPVLFNFLKFLKVFLINIVAILKTSAKLAILGLFRTNLFWNKGYGVIILVWDVINKILSHVSHYILNMVIWSKFGNSNISLSEAIITTILCGFDQKKLLFERCVWFEFNNLWLVIDMTFKFYISLTKGLKLKVRGFFGTNTFVRRN